MHDKRFDMPVSVALSRSGNTIYKVERVAQAADVLLNRWPAVAGKSHMVARKACLAVLEGIKEASVARAAFVKAAADADILREDDYGRG